MHDTYCYSFLQVGPYAPHRRLALGDHVLVGRTGFSVNRYDYGISERVGARWVDAEGDAPCISCQESFQI